MTKDKEKHAVKLRGLKMEIRSCEELKAILKFRIRAKIKNKKLAKNLENALGDIIAYGTGNGGGGNVA